MKLSISSELRNKIFTICIISLVNSVFLLSQTVNYFTGKVINPATSEPVPFAAITLKNNKLGVFANAEGDFKIINNPEFQYDSLIITCIGYKRSSLSFRDLNNRLVNKIFLTPSIYPLGEVNVLASRRKLSSVEIIGKAIRNIKNNYPRKPFSYIGYYRDYQKRGKEYINLNEAIVQTLNNGFSSESVSDKYRMLDFRKNMDFPRMNLSPYYDTVGTPGLNNPNKIIPNARIGDQLGNELFILMVHDAIRNYKTRSFSFVNTFSDDFLSNHEFEDPEKVFDNNLPLYKINFNARPRITGDTLVVSGVIYIQTKDFSIRKLEYSCSYLTKENEKKEMYNVDIEYGPNDYPGTLMCLKYLSFNNVFYVTDPEGTTYFRILDSYWDEKSAATMVFEFNNIIDPVSASRKDNYEIKVGKNAAKINSVFVRDKRVYIRLKNENIQGLKDSSSVNIKNIRDIKGNILDKRKVIEFNQFRELFVQEYNKTLAFKDSCYLQYLPLEQNCLSKCSGKDKYWMNTPENIKAGR
jgi:hypothetical protein